ncbi:MAG: HD domain-containing protein [Planctomycetaceae bacterium]|nr:HD domain-containing protein [Planctomycetales bacterium]MCB9922940.1 HD domain-containing protein [Planctomycetaceae bacterium]
MSTFDFNRRILIIDENMSIHADLRAALAHAQTSHREHNDRERPLPDDMPSTTSLPDFEIDSVFQEQAGFEMVKAAQQDGRPYSLAFVDIRMQSGWDGLNTTRKLLDIDDRLQIVIHTARPECLLDEVVSEFSGAGRVLLLRRPFAFAETRLLARSLTDKWRLAHEVHQRLQRQCDQIANTRRVMSIIQGCVDELENAHDELRGHAGLLAQRLEQRQAEIAGTRDLTMFALAQLADSRDPETGEHLLRMRAYAQLLAEYLSKHGPYVKEITRHFLAEFYRSTPLHDIGKVGIPDQILLKPGQLTPDEFEIMKRHTIIGAEAIESAARQSNFGEFLRMAAVIARSHHEKFDGGGYPDGLRGRDIPLCARITAVADVFDALTSARVYKEAMPCDEARELIVSQSGRHFDPSVVEAFEARFDEFLKVKAAVNEGNIDAGTPVVCTALPLALFETPTDRHSETSFESVSAVSTLLSL